jgi:hypothetical protein
MFENWAIRCRKLKEPDPSSESALWNALAFASCIKINEILFLLLLKIVILFNSSGILRDPTDAKECSQQGIAITHCRI